MKVENLEDLYTLSPMQEGMLFHSIYAENSNLYLRQMDCLLEGDLNVDAFESAWQQSIARHAILRTSFHWEDLDKPVQVVFKRADLPITHQDLRRLPVDEQREQVAAFIERDHHLEFDLLNPPLMRFALLRLEDSLYRFVWTYHHLLLDGWSKSLLIKEVFLFYDALCKGKRAQVERSHAYKEYIEWLRQQDLYEAQRFWQQRLAGFSTPTSIASTTPFDSIHDQGHQNDFDVVEARLSQSTTNALQSIAQQNRLTLSTLVQGAWALVLSRYSGNHDVVFGMVVSGRPAHLLRVESMVGVFINTLPVRAQVIGSEPLIPWLSRLQTAQLEMRSYEYTPLVQVQGWSEAPRGLPLFESILVFENYPINSSSTETSASVRISDAHFFERNNYPLTLEAVPSSTLPLKITYDSRRFKSDTVGGLLNHLKRALEQMAEDPARKLEDISLLADAELRQTIFDWNDTRIEYPSDKCIHELFERRATEAPEKIALAFKDRSFTYDELNRLSNQLAHYLIARGVGPEVRVGVCLERCPEMVIALLGILKAGGAYVPVDPAYPLDRMAFMIEDAQLPVLLTDERLIDNLPSHWGLVVCLDSEWQMIDAESDENLFNQVSPDNIAYIDYTSGSTGKPKGVEVCHRAVIRLLFGVDYVTLDRDRVVLNASPISFDASTFELWGALLHGGKCVLYDERVPTAQGLRDVIQKNSVDTMWLTSSLFNAVLDEDPQSLEGVTQLLVGGEALSVSHVRRAYESLPDIQIINGYGPTEGTTFTCCYRIPKDLSDITTSVPIGRPISNTRVYLLDPDMRPVCIGAPGELYVGGDGQARGYLARPELTGEKFVPDPFCAKPGARLYKTGDIARYRPDGIIEFINRNDQQVKIRGFRIEPGEIETALSHHAAVKDAVVTVNEDRPGNKRLVAYVVADGNRSIQPSELVAFLKSSLPDYMVPHSYVFLESLPLTANGKLDFRALPPAELEKQTSDSDPLPTRTPVEEILCGIWSEVLGLDHIGVDEDFFELGGHSLMATQIISRAREAFQTEIPIQMLFEEATIAKLAGQIERILKSDRALQAPPIETVARDAELPLSFAQQRLWFFQQLEPESATYNCPLAIRITGRLDICALRETLSEIARRHEALRTTFPSIDGRPVQRIHPAKSLELPVIDLAEFDQAEQGCEVTRLTAEEAARVFDLMNGPTLRASLLRLNELEHVALFTMHHIVSDGWSMGILVREVAALYKAFSRGEPSPLAELKLQYADFAHWQQQWLRGEVLEAQLAYWRQNLLGSAPLIELPTDRPRAKHQSFHGATQPISLGDELSHDLKELSRRENVTLFVTLMAALKALLFRLTGQRDLAVGTGIAGRNRYETEGLIGFFINMLVLRTDLSGNPTFRELLKRERAVALGAYAHQDLPYEKLVDELHTSRDRSYMPWLQVVLVLQNFPLRSLELEGLTLTPVGVSGRTSHFDLTFSLADTSRGIGGALQYNTDLFDDERISKILSHYKSMLEAVTVNPDSRLLDINLRQQQQMAPAFHASRAESLIGSDHFVF